MPDVTLAHPAGLRATSDSVTPQNPAGAGATVGAVVATWAQVGSTMDFTVLPSESWKSSSTETVNSWTLDFVAVTAMSKCGPNGSLMQFQGQDWWGYTADTELASSMKFKVDQADAWDDNGYEFWIVFEMSDIHCQHVNTWALLGITDENGDVVPEGLFVRWDSADKMSMILRSTGAPATLSASAYDPASAWIGLHITQGQLVAHHGTGTPPTDPEGLTPDAVATITDDGTWLGTDLYCRVMVANNGTSAYLGPHVDINKIHVYRNG